MIWLVKWLREVLFVFIKVQQVPKLFYFDLRGLTTGKRGKSLPCGMRDLGRQAQWHCMSWVTIGRVLGNFTLSSEVSQIGSEDCGWQWQRREDFTSQISFSCSEIWAVYSMQLPWYSLLLFLEALFHPSMMAPGAGNDGRHNISVPNTTPPPSRRPHADCLLSCSWPRSLHQ